MKALSSVLSFIVGVLLAMALLTLTGAIVARYFITKLTALPPKPVFTTAQAKRPASPASPKVNQPATVSANQPVANTKPSPATNEATAKPSPKPSPSASPKPSPTDGYAARVVQPIGLVLRSNPAYDSPPIGGIDFNQQVTVLEQSPDGVWIRVRLAGSNQEGWVKAGNTEKVN